MTTHCHALHKLANKVSFTITVVPKQGHPWQNHITQTNDAFAVDGVKGATIYLRRGVRYFFTFNQGPPSGTFVAGTTSNFTTIIQIPPIVFPPTTNFTHLLFFTTDPAGGKQGGRFPGDVTPTSFNPPAISGTPPPFGQGTMSFTVTNAFPKVFYYQDRNFQYLGGTIIVI
jgi:hypothetical protein